MARGINKVILVGNLGQDPDIRYSAKDQPFGTLNVATTEQWFSRENNTNEERTQWHRVRVFRGLAEIAERYLKKGHRIYVEGRLETRSYEQDGITKYATEIVAREMLMLGGRGDGDGGGGEAPMQRESRRPAADDSAAGQSGGGGRGAEPAKDSGGDPGFEDNLPF